VDLCLVWLGEDNLNDFRKNCILMRKNKKKELKNKLFVLPGPCIAEVYAQQCSNSG
jgi:hypothetical protein